MFKTVTAAALLLLTAYSHTAQADGNDLLKQCNTTVRIMDDGPQDGDRVGVGHCLGLVQGVMNVNMLYQVRPKVEPLFCLPTSGINNGQGVRIVVKYLKEHPERLQENETLLAVEAFSKAYPCTPDS